MKGRINEQEGNKLHQKLKHFSVCVRMCAHTPVEAAENVETPVFSSVEVHAEDGGEDEQHHGKVKHHHHCSLQENTENSMLFYGYG